MSFDAITSIAQAEDAAKVAVQYAKAQAKQMLADAEAAGKASVDASVVRAEKELVTDRLALLAGDWWENLSWGNAAVEMLKEFRFTEADLQAFASYITSYIRQTPGVADVKDVAFSMVGRQFRYDCTIETENGSANIHYE